MKRDNFESEFILSLNPCSRFFALFYKTCRNICPDEEYYNNICCSTI